MSITIAITDDHPMVRFGLNEMLRVTPGMSVVAQYPSGNALLAGLQKIVPDVLLLDIHLPDISGNELVGILQKEYPSIRIIVVTGVDSAFLAKSLLDVGAKGYLLKSTGQQQLATAVQKVMEGEIFLAPEVKDLLSQDALRKEIKVHSAGNLSEREILILKLIAQEYTTQEIADSLHLSPRTIDNYRLGLMQKLDVKNLAGLVRKAMLMGIVL